MQNPYNIDETPTEMGSLPSITVISGCSGTGKTIAALNFAQKPGSVFFVGDEGEGIVIQRKAAARGLDVTKTLFVPNTPQTNFPEVLDLLEKLLISSRGKRVVIDDSNRLTGLPPLAWTLPLVQMAANFEAHILVVRHSRIAPSEIASRAKAADSGILHSLCYIATNIIHLDAPFDTRPTGILVKGQAHLPLQVTEEMFGIKLLSFCGNVEDPGEHNPGISL